jgi:hypothetical protein
LLDPPELLVLPELPVAPLLDPPLLEPVLLLVAPLLLLPPLDEPPVLLEPDDPLSEEPVDRWYEEDVGRSVPPPHPAASAVRARAGSRVRREFRSMAVLSAREGPTMGSQRSPEKRRDSGSF